MTMTAILNALEERASIEDRMFLGENLGDIVRVMKSQFKRLWKNGSIDNYTSEFLSWANGYVNNFQPVSHEFRVSDCCDIHIIVASKREARAFAEWYMNS